MILNLRFLSGEIDDFILDMKIDKRSTFLQLHNAIQAQLGYDASQMASFFTTDKDWNKDEEITLIDMSEDDKTPVITMDKAVIEDFIQDMHQRYLYVYDLFSERCLFVEIMSVAEGDLNEPICMQQMGEVPKQIIIDYDMVDDELYGDDDLYDLDDLDNFDDDVIIDDLDDDFY